MSPIWNPPAAAESVDADVIRSEPRYLAGRYYGPEQVAGTSASGTIAIGTALFTPIFITGTASFDRIAAWVATAGAATLRLRLGIYDDDGGGKPGALIVDGGQVAGLDSQGLKEAVVDADLTRGLKWLIVAAQATGALANYAKLSASPLHQRLMPYDSSVALRGHPGYTATGATGAFPAAASSLTALALTTTAPVLALLRAA